MKIYHTETQEDYDALMVELEEQGCKWLTGDRPTETTYWHINREKTCVSVHPEGKMRIMSKEYHNLFHPDTPITKYKAKADEKMRFNKQNIERAFDKFMQGGDSFADLKERIINLVDEPEKVVVPKFVAEWYESQTSSSYNIQAMIENLINGSSLEELILFWLVKNYSKYGLRDRFDLLALIRLYGYTIEPEQLYYIPLPELQTSDGEQQMLSKRKNDTNYFVSRLNEKLQQRYTKEELERVPEVYKQYAKLVEEEEE